MELAGWGKLACFRAQKYAIQYPQIALFSPQIKYVSSPFHIFITFLKNNLILIS